MRWHQGVEDEDGETSPSSSSEQPVDTARNDTAGKQEATNLDSVGQLEEYQILTDYYNEYVDR